MTSAVSKHEAAIRQMRAEGITAREIAQRLGLNTKQVQGYCHRHGIALTRPPNADGMRYAKPCGQIGLRNALSIPAMLELERRAIAGKHETLADAAVEILESALAGPRRA